MRPSPFVVPCLLVLLAASCPALELGVAVACSGGAVIVKDARFDAGLQPALTAGAVAELAGEQGWGGGLALEADFTGPSALRDLVSYRGTSGARLRLFGSWEDRRPGSVLALSARAGLLASYRRYTETEVWFVSAGFFLEPLLAIRLPGAPWLTVRVGTPLVLERRADLSFSGAVGLSVEAGGRLRTGAPLRE